MNNYVTCFRLFTHLGVNIWQQVCSTKTGYANALLLGTNSRKKGNVNALESAHQVKKQCNLKVVGLNDNKVVHIASSKFSEPKRFAQRLKKVEGKYFQEQQPN